nr:transposase [Niabella aurantiaca]
MCTGRRCMSLATDLRKRGLKEVYGAVNRDAAEIALEKLSEKWGHKYCHAIKSWRNNWDYLTSYFDFLLEIRKIIYTTNLIENLNRGI